MPEGDSRAIPQARDTEPSAPGPTTQTTVIGSRRALVTVLPDTVLFTFDRFDITSDAEGALNDIVELFRNRQATEATVAGHASNEGSAPYNTWLAQQRADSVRDYLINAGVPHSRVRAASYGATQPVASNATEGGRRANRRVEVVVYLS